jgi:3,4-dihydroxy 2-butanone 4-phosphate synthase/GTP cyclohydrolase II
VNEHERRSGRLRESLVPPPGARGPSRGGAAPLEVARLTLGTVAGEFELRAFECATGFVYLGLIKGDLADGRSVLCRLHSECLTGDALGSLRCDCGLQLHAALRTIAAEGRGVLIYATGHEGRGIGLVEKLRTYMLQEDGLDTLDANHHLGLPADARDYGDAGACLVQLGVRSVRLLTNNPRKEAGVRAAGVGVDAVVPLPTSPNLRNIGYLTTKARRLGHAAPAGDGLVPDPGAAVDVTGILGRSAAPATRPYVALKYAQTLDGRIATHTGDSKWISGEPERCVSHALRAACDAVLVGVGTVIADDPQLTVRLVRGSSPLRVVLDSTLRLPRQARILDDEAATIVMTTERSTRARRRAIEARGVGVRVIQAGDGGVDLRAALARLRHAGVRSVLVEGGAEVITSFLRAQLVDRLVVAIAPTIVGAGTEAVGDLRIARVRDGVRLSKPTVYAVGDDVVMAADVAFPAARIDGAA